MFIQGLFKVFGFSVGYTSVCSLESDVTINQERDIKGIEIGKVEIKLSLFVGNIMLYLENPKNSKKNSF